jgi:hypothetical protein
MQRGSGRSTGGCCVLRLPQRRTVSLRCRSLLWLRRLQAASLRWLPYFPARPGANPTVSDRRSTAWLDWWQTSGSHRLLRTSNRPSVNLPACAGVPPSARPAATSDSHRSRFFSPARVQPSGFRRRLLQPSACAVCCCGCQLALPSARLPHRPRTSDSHRLFLYRLYRFQVARLAPCASTSGWASDAPLASTEPCIVGGAVDEYSVYAGSCTFRICQL